MRLACASFTTRGSSSNTVGVLRRGSFSGCSLFGFFLLTALQSTPSACPTQVPSHLPSALKGTAVYPLDESQGLSRSGFFNDSTYTKTILLVRKAYASSCWPVVRYWYLSVERGTVCRGHVIVGI